MVAMVTTYYTNLQGECSRFRPRPPGGPPHPLLAAAGRTRVEGTNGGARGRGGVKGDFNGGGGGVSIYKLCFFFNSSHLYTEKKNKQN